MEKAKLEKIRQASIMISRYSLLAFLFEDKKEKCEAEMKIAYNELKELMEGGD